MAYPKTLLPQQFFKIIDPNDIIDKFYLIRRFKGIHEQLFDYIGDIRTDILFIRGTEERYDDIYEWSTNLLGIFTVDYLSLIVTNKELNKYWNEGDVSKEIKDEDFIELDEFIPIFLLVSDINELEFNYDKFDGTKLILTKGICRVIHKPTFSNFWHFEIHFFEKDSETRIKGNTEWKKQAAKNFLKTHLKALLSGEKPDEYNILKESCYVKAS